MVDNKNILVTGASGLIGREVVNQLQNEGLKVLTLGRADNSSYKINLALEGQCLTRKIPRPDFVVHLAALVPFGKEQPDLISTGDKTQIIDQNILDACKEWTCPVIYASGCSLYVNKENQELSEKDSLKTHFVSPYLKAKSVGDFKYRAYKLGTVLRISCPIGTNRPSNNVLSAFINQLKTNGEINVYGTGTREQDFVDVRDIAEAINCVLLRDIRGVFNIASAVPTTMRSLAEIIVDNYGKGKIIIRKDPDPQEGATARYSIALAKELLGWFPKFDLRSSIKSIVGYC